MSLSMTKQERKAFLADVHVGIIIIAEEGRGPLTVPVWYAYDFGKDMCIMTGRESRKGRLLARAGRFSLCAQTESPPYKYVSVMAPFFLPKRRISMVTCARSAAAISGKEETATSRNAKLAYAYRYHRCPNASRTMADQRLLQRR